MIKTTQRYTLEPYAGGKTRFPCPGCGHQNTFSRYIDTVTGEYLSPACGRCNREQNCGYHLKPRDVLPESKRDYSYTHRTFERIKPKEAVPIKISEKNVIDKAIFEKSLQGYDNNAFVRYLISLFGEERTQKLIAEYFIGSSRHWEGSTVFWQIDAQGRIRAGKVMLYNETTGKRIKEPQACITWVHKIISIPDYELRQCFFGEHLLRTNTDKTVAIVESEKTAIIASVYLPEFIWMASGGLNNINPERMAVLKRRRVILFPDANGYEKWKAKAKLLPPDMVIGISSLLEDKATEEEKHLGYDLADYLIKQPVPKVKIIPEVDEQAIDEDLDEIVITESEDYFRRKPGYSAPTYKLQDWSERIAKIESVIGNACSDSEIVLSPGMRITDTKKFLASHLEIVKINAGKDVYLPYLERLEYVLDKIAN
jgi:hypothetical protein